MFAINFGQIKGLGILGLGEAKGPGEAPGLFTSFLSGAIGLMTVIAAIWFIFSFITGAVGIITAGGDKAKVESAKNKITSGIIGIVVVIAALFIIQFVASLVGLGNIILDPTSIIDGIMPK